MKRIWKIQLFKDGRPYANSPMYFRSEEQMEKQLKMWDGYLYNQDEEEWIAYYGEVEEE